ncbi:hypothetical protein OKW43_003121 [Paraburkholderia sp. WC7.3g]
MRAHAAHAFVSFVAPVCGGLINVRMRVARLPHAAHHQLSRIRMPRGHRKPRATLRHAPDRRQIRQIQTAVDAHRVEIHRERDEIDVAGALAIAEQTENCDGGEAKLRELREGPPTATGAASARRYT